MTYTEMKNEQDLMQVVGTLKIGGIDFEFYGDIYEPLFLASKVAVLLNERDGSTVARKVHNTEKVTHLVCSVSCDTQNVCSTSRARKTQEALFLTEFGLYEVFMKSKKQEAKQFHQDVKFQLKQIRLTGGYIPVSAEDTEEMIEQRAKEIASKTIAIKDEIIAELQAENEKLQAEVDFHKEDVKDCERLIGVLCEDVKYLFNDTDFGVRSISDAYVHISNNVNGSRKFVQWFNKHNEKVEVIDVYVDDNGSRIKNAIDLSDINIFHDFKDLVFAYQQEQQGFTRSK